MIRSSLALPTVAALLTLLAFAPSSTSAHRFQSDGTITEGGYFYSFYEAVNNQQTYLDTVSGGLFSMQWREASKNAVGGVGWEQGSTGRRIRFAITQFDVHNDQKQTVAIYGWMRDRQSIHSGVVEYYVVEDHRKWNESEANARYKGWRTVDNAVYSYYEADRFNSAQAFSSAKINFKQYWAVREQTKRRLSGTVNMRAHFDNWARFGLRTKPIHGYQILAVEGYEAQGFAQGYARAA